MDVKSLRDALNTLLEDNPERATEPVCQTVQGRACLVTGITVVVESDDWVPGTIVIESKFDDEEDEDTTDSS